MSFELSVDVSEPYDFNQESLVTKIHQNPWVKDQWPIVYFIQNEVIAQAYVGESTNAYGRIKNHLSDQLKALLFNKISIICLLYTSPSPRDQRGSRMPSSA